MDISSAPKRHLLYLHLVLNISGRFGTLTIGFLMANNPYQPVLVLIILILWPILNSLRKDGKNDGL